MGFKSLRENLRAPQCIVQEFKKNLRKGMPEKVSERVSEGVKAL